MLGGVAGEHPRADRLLEDVAHEVRCQRGPLDAASDVGADVTGVEEEHALQRRAALHDLPDLGDRERGAAEIVELRGARQEVRIAADAGAVAGEMDEEQVRGIERAGERGELTQDVGARRLQPLFRRIVVQHDRLLVAELSQRFAQREHVGHAELQRGAGVAVVVAIDADEERVALADRARGLFDGLELPETVEPGAASRLQLWLRSRCNRHAVGGGLAVQGRF